MTIYDETFNKQDLQETIENHKKYYTNYKNLDKNNQKNNIAEINPSPFTIIQTNLEKNLLLPVTAGIFQKSK